MRPIRVSVSIPAPPEDVWAEVEKVEDHAEWMADAVDISFESEQRRGVGTRISVLTKVGPFRTTDEMEFTEWVRGEAMGVVHHGVFTGTGRFTLEPDGDGTRFTWTESVRFPWFLGGPVAALAARPLLTMIWRRNLRRLRERLSGP